MLYSSAMREDLFYVTSHNKNLCNIVAIVKCGFRAVHNIINLACPIVKMTFKEGTCITHHFKHVHEYVLQSALVGNSMSDWQQWIHCLLLYGNCIRQLKKSPSQVGITTSMFIPETKYTCDDTLQNNGVKVQ